jgi:hypothetical protein
MNADDIVAEVQAARRAILAEFDDDLAAYVADARRRQAESGHSVVPAPPPPADRDAA